MSGDGKQNDFRLRESQAGFGPTRWSLVLRAKDGCEQALADLCSIYWYPAYTFARRQGRSPEDAKDMVQIFFSERFLSGRFFQNVEPAKGTFRSWFCQSLRFFLRSQSEAAAASKRGGALTKLPLDTLEWEQAEGWYQGALVDESSPDRFFDRALGTALVARVLTLLGQEYDQLGKGGLFRELHPLLASRDEHGSHAQLAQRLGISEGAVRVGLSRLRRRFGDALLDEVHRMTSSIEEARTELGALLQAWAEAGAPLHPSDSSLRSPGD